MGVGSGGLAAGVMAGNIDPEHDVAEERHSAGKILLQLNVPALLLHALGVTVSCDFCFVAWNFPEVTFPWASGEMAAFRVLNMDSWC